MGYLNLEIDELQKSMGHQGCSDLDVGKLRLDFHGDAGGVPTRTPTLKSGSARGTRYRVYNTYLNDEPHIYSGHRIRMRRIIP